MRIMLDVFGISYPIIYHYYNVGEIFISQNTKTQTTQSYVCKSGQNI